MQSSMQKILLIGSTCVDVIIEIDHLPKTAEDIQPKRQTLALGGCAYNAANIVRQSGVPYLFVTPIELVYMARNDIWFRCIRIS